jgi:alpha-tubulin suppressor-like RCC1 family protein
MTVQVDGGPEAQAPGSFGATAIAALPVTLPAGGATLRASAYDHVGNRASLEHRYAAAPAFTSLSVSGLHSCALTADGAAYCWGSNGLAELGTGTVGGESATPVAVAGGHRFRAISTGARHGCGIALDGAAWCWGMLAPERAPEAATAPAPERVASGAGFRSLSAGSYHTCALDAEGAAWCWGVGSSGQLGHGAFVEWSDTPVRVQGGHLFRSLSAGHRFTCGVTLVGKGYCWGDNRQGQLGDGTNEERLLPTAVGGALEWKEIDAGVEHACGIAADGRAYCWGSDFNGGLGGAEIVGARSLPALVDWPGTFRSISASSYACGLTTEGQLVCWGGLDPNRLGIPGHRTSNFGRPTLGMGGMTFASVSTGRGTCTLAGSGITYCFGTNDF